MQDIHTLGGVGGGGGGRIFSGGVDRRLQPQNLPNHPPLKCPRCDSQNTKFCYYNNYNLSQPRHFCKTCRRYWTKGGVLRNVPVGGGCRKSKRSSKGKSSTSNNQAATDSSKKNEGSENNSHSSSESSSLTATTMATKDIDAAVGAGAGTASSSNSGLFLGQRRGDNDDFDHYQLLTDQRQGARTATKDIGQMVVNMVSPSHDPGLIGSSQEWPNDSEKLMNKEFIDQHHGVQVDPTALDQQIRERNSGISTLDWRNVGTLGDVDVINTTGVSVGGGSGGCCGSGGGAGEHGLFDFTGVDEAYWNQAQWVDDNDQAFNFLPQFQVLDFNLEKK